jgi:crossover junction endodeoxyribonuclease RuvC
MIILGIDPGIADTGFGIISRLGDVYKHITHGSIKTSKSDELSQRLQDLHIELSKLIKKYKPNRIAIEQLFFAKNVKTALTVAHARGVVLLASKQANSEIYEFTPLQIKLALTGYGSADKKQMQELVKTTLNLKQVPKPDDAADALAAAICCAQTKTYE